MRGDGSSTILGFTSRRHGSDRSLSGLRAAGCRSWTSATRHRKKRASRDRRTPYRWDRGGPHARAFDRNIGSAHHGRFCRRWWSVGSHSDVVMGARQPIRGNWPQRAAAHSTGRSYWTGAIARNRGDGAVGAALEQGRTNTMVQSTRGPSPAVITPRRLA